MATPSTVAAAGFFVATDGSGATIGEATIWMPTATQGTLTFQGRSWTVVGDPAKKTLRATAGSVMDLRIKTRNLLTGTVDGAPLQLARSVLRPISAAEMAQSDPGPTGSIKAVMDGTPNYRTAVGDNHTFWYAFGPVLYRGRLDGTARLLGIASDPGPSECLPFARRTLIGDSGQKTQGLLAKLGLTRSYVLVNGFAVALHPSQKTTGLDVLKNNAAIRTARHALYDALLAGGSLQAIVAFGDVAHTAYDLWAAANPAVTHVPVLKLAHPAAVDRTGSGNDAALKGWHQAVATLRGIVTADPDGDPTVPNFGAYFTEVDYARIPRWDFPRVTPAYVGDDSWGRSATPRHNNCCDRPSPDDGVSLVLTPPAGQGAVLRYRFKDGALAGATDQHGKTIAVNDVGIPL